MSKNPTKHPGRSLGFKDIGFIALFLLVLALSGFLTVLGNLTGVADATYHIIPPVDNLQGLMSTTLILTGLGCIPILFRLARPAGRS